MGPLIYLFTLVKLGLVLSTSTCELQIDSVSIRVFSLTTLNLTTNSTSDISVTVTFSAVEIQSNSSLTQTINATNPGTFEFFASKIGTLEINLDCGTSENDTASITVNELSLSGLGPTVIHI